MSENWVEDFIKSDESLHIDNFKGTENLIAIYLIVILVIGW